jgi:hypothetical protein
MTRDILLVKYDNITQSYYFSILFTKNKIEILLTSYILHSLVCTIDFL